MRTTTELRGRASEIAQALTALDEAGNWTTAQRAEFDALNAELPRIEDELERAQVREALKRGTVEMPTGPSVKAYRSGIAGEARQMIDASARGGLLPDHAAQAATSLVEQGPQHQRDIAARWAAATGQPEYLRAFSALVVNPERGHLTWSGEELEAYRRVDRFREEMRAMGLSDSAGGYMVPLTLDPSILLTSDGSINPLRRIGRVVRTTTDTWQGVSSAGVTAEWLAEASEAADAAPTLAGPSVPVYKATAWVPFSIEVGQDAVDFVHEITTLLVDGADQLQATAFTTGSGSGQPTGIITALIGGSSIVTSTTEAVNAADAVSVQNALPPRFQGNAQWCANIATINALGALETTSGSLRFPEIGDGRLLRKAMNELSNMDGSINPAATASNYVLLYGDFSNYVIADRIGTTVELVPHLMGANGRPTGQRGLWMYTLVGADSVNDAAFRLLNVATTA